MPKVSLAMPTYNGARYLREAIDAILGQSFADFELIVVIDGSSDETREILKTYSDARIRVIDKPRNEGLPAAINTGLDAAVGDYWAWTSDDNVYLPGALAQMAGWLDAHPDCALVAPHLYNIDENRRRLGISDEMNCFLCRRQAALDVGRYRTEYMLVEDVDFFIRMEHRYGPPARLREPLYEFRVHATSLSTTQIKKRQLVSVKLHYDLITRGIERGDLETLFFDRVMQASLYKGYDWAQQIVDFARAEKLPFADALQRRLGFYQTRHGWLWLKTNVAVGRRLKSALGKLRDRIRRPLAV
ncbi:MAG TPA: glycosyltransferase [Polyangia bacterium]|nr:glycosyltransferase [Polyangia bacterium]